MIFLEGPSLGDTKEVWIAWLERLHKMNQRDNSVKFAISDAEQIIKEMERFEVEQSQLACA